MGCGFGWEIPVFSTLARYGSGYTYIGQSTQASENGLNFPREGRGVHGESLGFVVGACTQVQGREVMSTETWSPLLGAGVHVPEETRTSSSRVATTTTTPPPWLTLLTRRWELSSQPLAL